MSSPDFSLSVLQQQFEQVLKNGYRVITCESYYREKPQNIPGKILVNRVDIDWSCVKAKKLAEIFNHLGIKASFFVRLHAPEYNPFSFENYLCLKYIRDTGHEIGYHSEVIDQSAIWNEDPADCLQRDIRTLNNMLLINVKGVASHGGITGLNNLDFWKDKKASDFGLWYEAYDKQPGFNLFQEAFYVSDSNYRWKCYDKGVLQAGNIKSIAEHTAAGHSLMYTNIHPETYYTNHIYE